MSEIRMNVQEACGGREVSIQARSDATYVRYLP